MTEEQTERFVCAFEKIALALTDLADSTGDIAGAIEGKNHLDIEIYGLRPVVEALKEQAEAVKNNKDKK